jgi:hypothetical protein
MRLLIEPGHRAQHVAVDVVAAVVGEGLDEVVAELLAEVGLGGADERTLLDHLHLSTAVITSITRLSSAGAPMPTCTSFCTTVRRVAAVALTSKVPGMSARMRNEPSSLV